MEKEEILERAQSKKPNTPDEMELQVVQKGNGIAVFCILIFCLILMIVKMIAGGPWYDVYSILFVSMAAQHIYKGIKLGQRHHLAMGIASGAVSIAMLAAYIYQVL